MANLYTLFNEVARSRPNKDAIIFEDEATSYNDLLNRIDLFSSNLNRLKSEEQAHIAVCLPNSSDLIAIAFAVAKLRLTLIPISDSLKPVQIRDLLQSTDCDFLITSAYTSSVLSDLESFTNIQTFSVDKLHQVISDTDMIPVKSSDQKDFLIILSSGSTGQPKPIVLSQDVKIKRSLQARDMFSVTESDIVLCASPFFHSLGQRLSFLPLLLGSTLILLDKFTPAKWLDAVANHAVSFTIPVSSHLAALQTDLVNHYQRLSSLRAIVSSSAYIEPVLKKLFQDELNCEFHEMYGATEVATATDLSPQAPLDKAMSVGKAWHDVDIKIIDDNLQVIESGVIGEIACKTPLMFSGYYKQVELTSESMLGDYFLTGDLGYLDSDGYLYYRSRKKDIIISGGINIIPADIENVICLHPNISECVVIGIKDKYFGEAVYAICTCLQDNPAQELELRRFIKDKLANYQYPLGYDFVESIKLTETGKFDKVYLRKFYNDKELDLSRNLRTLMKTHNR